MIPVVTAAALFGCHWSGKIVEFEADNEAVVGVLNATFSNDLHLMHLIWVLVFLAATFNFWFVASHIPGIKNVTAVALSRNALSSFFLRFLKQIFIQPSSPHLWSQWYLRTSHEPAKAGLSSSGIL